MIQTNPKNDVTLEIDTVSHGVYGIARHEGRVVMVPGTVAGDRVRARPRQSKGAYVIADLEAIVAPSTQRRVPPCPYVGTCGGCPWQQMDHGAQLSAKQRNVEDALRRIGKLKDFEVLPVIAAPREFHYRRRIRLRCDGRRLGFSRSASHELVAIDSCEIAEPRANLALAVARQWADATATPLSEIEIVSGEKETELVLVAAATGPFARFDDSVTSAMVAQGAGVSGAVVKGKNWRRVWGNTHITVVPEPGITLAVEADAFTQVYPEANRMIVQQLLHSGAFARSDRVLELYCGAGNFTLSLARRAGAVVAVEGHRNALDSARENARRHGLENIAWQLSSVPPTLTRLAHRHEKFSKIVLDPPRAGAKGIAADLAALRADTLLYISCDPATLARDLAALTHRGYSLKSVQPLDLFPQTFHVETLAVLELR